MPIIPARRDKEAQEDNLAALLLLVLAQLPPGSPMQQLDSLIEQLRSMKAALKNS